MMPKKDVHEVLKEIIAIESNNNIFGKECSIIIMISALNDSKNIIDAFGSQCDGYPAKPVDKAIIENELKIIGLLD